jgi:nucleoid DNA-binding protein
MFLTKERAKGIAGNFKFRKKLAIPVKVVLVFKVEKKLREAVGKVLK